MFFSSNFYCNGLKTNPPQITIADLLGNNFVLREQLCKQFILAINIVFSKIEIFSLWITRLNMLDQKYHEFLEIEFDTNYTLISRPESGLIFI